MKKKKRLIIITSIAVLFFMVFLGDFLYQKYTWQKRIKIGMTRKEFEEVVPYSKEGFALGFSDNYFTSFSVGELKIEANFKHNFNDNEMDDTLIKYEIKKC